MRISDWSSDVCSSDPVLAMLHAAPGHTPGRQYRRHIHQEPLMNRNTAYLAASAVAAALAIGALSGAAQAQSKTAKCFGVAKAGKNDRSDDSRVGKEGGSTCRSRGSRYNKKKKK